MKAGTVVSLLENRFHFLMCVVLQVCWSMTSVHHCFGFSVCFKPASMLWVWVISGPWAMGLVEIMLDYAGGDYRELSSVEAPAG